MTRGFWTGIPVELLISGSNVSSPEISPNGMYIAYTKGTEKGSQLFVFEIANAEHSQLTFGGSLSTGTPYGGKTYCWSEDSSSIFLSIKGQLYSVSIKGGIPQNLESYEFSFAPSHRQRKLVFSVEHKNHMSLGLFDAEEFHDQLWPLRIPISENFLYDASFHPLEDKIAVHTWSFPNMSWNGSRIEIITSMNNYKSITRKVVAGSESVATSQPKWSPEGNYLSFLCEEMGWLNLWIADSDGTNARPLVDEPHEHAYSTWVTGGSQYVWINEENIIYCRNTNGYFSLVLVEVETGKTTPINFKDGYFSSLSSSLKNLVVHFTDHGNRGQILLFDLDSLRDDGSISEPKSIAESGVRHPKNMLCKPIPIEFLTENNQKCHAMIYSMGDNLGEAPIIVNVHGGPTGMRTNSWNTNAQYFASRGYVFVELNYRGSIGFGREYRNALNGNWGILDVEDSIHVLNYLKKEKIGNIDKAAIMGGSAGGFTVLMVMATRPGKYKAGIDLFGVSDNFILAEDTHYLESRYSDSLVGPLPEASEKYFAQSPFFLAKDIVDPLLILQGEDDPVVLKSQSEIMIAAVSGPVESKFYPEEGHGFQKPENIKDALERTEKFLKKYVLYTKPDFMI